MQAEELYYDLPREKIAQEPSRPRDSAKLLVSVGESFQVDTFLHLDRYLPPHALLIYNETKVWRARLFAQKETGGGVELFIVRLLGKKRGIVLCRSRKKLKLPLRLFCGRAALSLTEAASQGLVLESDTPLTCLMQQQGVLPLPPYIHRPLQREEDYQPIFARRSGSAAAPTAALHFTPRLLKKLAARGLRLLPLCLHIGTDTFLPIRTERVEEHPIHTEFYAIPVKTQQAIAQARARRAPIVALGTTTVRALETFAKKGCPRGATDLFIVPGFSFELVDFLITNFHAPRSPLLALVMAFAGKERVRKAYQKGLAEGFRFLSFGDGMLLKRKSA